MSIHTIKLQLLRRGGKASAYLDLARALAAMEVLLYHMRGTIFVPYRDVRHKSIVDTALYALCTKGHQAVMVFFVLSGFFIGSSALRQIQAGRWSWFWYLNNRLSRLWLVLIPALVLTIGWNELSMALFRNKSVVGAMNLNAFFADMFYLQGVGHIPSVAFGENDPLWSLMYEFWYYILFPCFVLMFSSRRWTTKLIYLIFFVAISIFVGKKIMLYFLVWILGALVTVIPSMVQLIAKWPRRIVLSASIIVFLGVLAKSSRGGSFQWDFVLGMTFTLVLYIVVACFNERAGDGPRFFHGVYGLLAGFSYTLYLTHYPINNFLGSWLGIGTLQPTISRWALFFFGIIAVMLFAFVISRITETHTDSVRKFIDGLVKSGAKTKTSRKINA